MLIGHLNMKIDERAYAYTQQVLKDLNFESDEITISKDKLEETLYDTYKKGFQTGVDVITEAVQSANPNFQFIKKD